MRLLGGSGDLLLFFGGVGDIRRFLGGVRDRFLLRSDPISSLRVDSLVGLDSARSTLAFLASPDDLDSGSKVGVGVEERDASVDAQDDEEAEEDDEEEDEDDGAIVARTFFNNSAIFPSGSSLLFTRSSSSSTSTSKLIDRSASRSFLLFLSFFFTKLFRCFSRSILSFRGCISGSSSVSSTDRISMSLSSSLTGRSIGFTFDVLLLWASLPLVILQAIPVDS